MTSPRWLICAIGLPRLNVGKPGRRRGRMLLSERGIKQKRTAIIGGIWLRN